MRGPDDAGRFGIIPQFGAQPADQHVNRAACAVLAAMGDAKAQPVAGQHLAGAADQLAQQFKFGAGQGDGLTRLVAQLARR